MTFVVSDRTQDTTTSVGPTAFTISGTPVTGCQSFLSGIGVGNTTYLTITDGVFWMDVLATVTSSTLITVTQVLAGSAGFTISSNFTATGVTKQVFCTYPASKAVIQDANNTVNLNNFAPAISPITSAGATTTLTAASAHIQRITGTLAQTIKLPDQTTLPSNGIAFLIDNKATQNVTIADSAGTTLATAVPGAAILLYSTSNSTATGNWDGYACVPTSVQWGSGALGVAYGGTGVATLSGIAFGNGTGAFTAATGAQIASALGSTAISGNAAGLSATLAVGSGGTGVTTSTGSGSVVLSNSPTLVTPALGTPASGILTNCTFPTLNQNTTGTAAGLSTTLVATSGGTGKSTTVVGDLIQGGATNTWATLAAVATGNALISGGVGAASSWGKIGLTTHISGTLAVGNGGTGLTSLTAGYIPYGNDTGALNSSAGLFFDGTNLGIGTSSPSSGGKLYVVAADAGTALALQSGTGTLSYAAFGGSGFFQSNNSLTIGCAGASPLTFRTNSLDRLAIDSSGNVGIGTSSPNGKLHVGSTITAAGSSTTTPTVITSDSTYGSNVTGSNFKLKLFDSTASYLTYGFGVSFNTLEITSGNGGAIAFYRNGATPTESMRIDSSGNVGIGTSSPASKLSIVGTSGTPQLNVGTASNIWSFNTYDSATSYLTCGGSNITTTGFGSSSNIPLFFVTNNIEKMRIDTAGKIWQQVNATTTANYFAWGDNTTTYAQIGGYRDSATTGHLELYTLNGGTSTEAVRIDSVGNTYIETGNLWQYAPAPTSISVATTLTAAQLQTTIINTTGATGYTVTLPLASAIDTAFVGVPTTNIGFDFYVVNTASGTITMAVNTGITAIGTLTILTGISAHFRLRRTAANTYILYRIG